MENKRAVLLLSGGIDSTTLLSKLSNEKYEIIAISFNYGQKNKIELNFAKKNAKKYNVKKHFIFKLDHSLFSSSALVNKDIDVKNYENNEQSKDLVNTYVPYRNLLFISSAMSLAESLNINEVYTAFNSDDSLNFWDCKPVFIEKLNSISTSNHTIEVKTPFINLSKSEVIKLARQLNVDLNNTITCYQPNKEIECGYCLSCVTKQKAIEIALT